MTLPFEYDWRNPDVAGVIRWRAKRLEYLRENPEKLPLIKKYYKDHPAEFISHWGMTFDPRNLDMGLSPIIPFVLFPKQAEWVEWFIDRWKSQEHGLTEKTRDMGMSWLCVAVACHTCLFYDGAVVGMGSRKEEYVDKLDSPKSLFYKIRMFLDYLPREFKGSWDRNKHAPHMRIIFPDTGSVITGEAGDNIGRGDRTSWYLVDEAAHIERPSLVDAALSATTRCRQDVSSVNGRANSFAEKRFSGNIKVFTFHWRDDPRKDDAWYARQVETLDPITVAQEIDINYSASVEGVLIPSAWVQSAIDADKKLGIVPTGERIGALDVADEGKDKNAFCVKHGISLMTLSEWSGKGGDIFETVQKTFFLADENQCELVYYDSDGLGSGSRGDARIINDNRTKKLNFEPFRGSGEIFEPDREMVKGRLNKDFFQNAKAQAWWALRMRFQNVHRWVTEGIQCDPDEIISIPASLPHLSRLMMELSQPTYKPNLAGKIIVEKTPEGTKSPNLADAVMICYAPRKKSIMSMWEKLGQ